MLTLSTSGVLLGTSGASARDKDCSKEGCSSNKMAGAPEHIGDAAVSMAFAHTSGASWRDLLPSVIP